MNTITRVYELLDDRALSLTKLAEMSGVAYSTIKMAESRNTQLSVDTIERICNALGITLSEFFAEPKAGYKFEPQKIPGGSLSPGMFLWSIYI